MIVEDGQVGFGKKLAAWWRGSDLVIQGKDSRKRKVKIRHPADKDQPGGAGARTAGGQARAKSAKAGAGAKRSGGAAKAGLAPAKPKPDPSLPKARRLTPQELGEAEKGLEEENAPIQNLDDGQLMKHLWGAASRTPGGINGAVEIMEPILRGMDPHKKVLDLFAGDGRLGKYLETYHQADFTGYETSKNLVDLSNGNIRHFDPKRANFGDEQFDYVCAAEGMQDIEDKQSILQAAADAMKVGGKMVLVDALTQSTTGHAPYMARLDGFLAPVLSARFYKRILEECGLKVIGTKNITQDYQKRVSSGWSKATGLFRDRKMDEGIEEISERAGNPSFQPDQDPAGTGSEDDPTGDHEMMIWNRNCFSGESRTRGGRSPGEEA